MIQNEQLSGRQVCMLLYEQGYLTDDGSYAPFHPVLYPLMILCTMPFRPRKLQPGELALQPCSGSCVITDPDNGEYFSAGFLPKLRQ